MSGSVPSKPTTRGRLLQLTEHYRKQYREQQRLSLGEIDKLASQVIDSQAKYIEYLEDKLRKLIQLKGHAQPICDTSEHEAQEESTDP